MSRKEEILDFIKKEGPVEQAEIVKHFEDHYKNKGSATNAISRFLRQLNDEKLIQKKTVENIGRGSIDKNLWEKN